MKRTTLAALVLVFPLAACAGKTPPSPATSTSVSVPASAASPTAITSTESALESARAAAGESAKNVFQLTEDNDSNNLLGRPGGYSDAAVAQLNGLTGTCDPSTPGVDCGLTVEVWKSQTAATARAKDIQTKLSTYGLGSEYDFVKGSTLLRISGEVKPSEASEINARFGGMSVTVE